MSVNITVNGEYMKSCPKHYLLYDQERLQKEAENERRKLRIQQVRAASKDMAKKVRNKVEMEKEKQLKKIEEIKEKEMEMWRQKLLRQKEANYMSAIFEIGTAHRAAKRENQRKPQQPKIIAKPRTPKVGRYKGPTTSKGKENQLKDSDVQTEITGTCYPEPSHVIRGLTQYESDSSDEDTAVCANILSTEHFSRDLLNSSSSSCSTCLSAEFSKLTYNFADVESLEKRKNIEPKNLEQQSGNKSPKKKLDAVSKKLKKAVPIAVEVQRPKSVSPKKTLKTKDKSKAVPTPKFDNKDNQLDSSQDERVSRPTDPKKRFTQITDIIRQYESTENVSKPSVSPSKSKSKSPTSMRTLQTQTTLKSTSPSRPKSPTSTRTQTMRKPTSPLRSKSPVSIRTNQTQTSLKPSSPSKSKSPAASQTILTSASKLSAGPSGRVQFYDHNNKFQKQYNQPAFVVQAHKGPSDGIEMNAMEQALLAQKLREAREEEIDKLRQKTDERCQKAIEREQVRRACEDLTAKLDALNKQRQLLPSDNHHFSSVRLGQTAAEKEAKLNTAVENILRRPAVITCPPINRQQNSSTTILSAPVTSDLNLGSTVNDVNSLNSSDSCCSILLGYVEGQTKQLADDIKKYNNQNGETGKVKAEKLQDLLNRINRLRESLISEIAKYTSSTSSDKNRVQTLMDSINQFRKERESILIERNPDDITKREITLKKKEAILEKKVREFYKIQKAVKKNPKPPSKGEEESEDENVSNSDEKQEQRCSMPQNTEEDDESPENSVDPQTQIGAENDFKEKDRTRYKYTKDKTAVRKREGCRQGKENIQPITKCDESKANRKLKDSEGRTSDEESDDSYEEYVEHKEVVVDKKPLEIVIKVRGSKKAKKTKSPRKLSTLIQSPIASKNRKKVSTVRSNDSSSTSYRSLPTTIHNGMEDLLVTGPLSTATAVESKRHNAADTSVKKKSSTLNPLMAHYVQRLLGMSRSSINALGMLSSDIDTPSSSIINTTSNLSSAETEKLASSRLENVQKFIENNYSFINEFEESLRHSNTREASSKTVELVWKKTLKEQKNPEDNRKDSENKTKKPPSPKLDKKHLTEQPHSKDQPVQVNKSTQLTDNCTQRIAQLSAMIEKIRQEKQKLLETTFSSASDNGPNSTEYMDLPECQNERSGFKSDDGQLSESNESSNDPPTQSHGNVPQLEKNKSIGISRDSGISLSRPITVQEVRIGSVEVLNNEQSSTESLSMQNKPPRPPISIARYSPQLVEDVPHELSTIFEVETPATSKINTSINGQKTDSDVQLQNDQPKEINYKKFPTFEEYARLNQLDMSQFDPEFSMQFEREFNEFMQLAKEGKIADYEKFTSFNKYIDKSSNKDDKEAAEEFLESLKMANLSFKKFPTRKEYLNKMGVSSSDLLDSQSLEYMDDSKVHNSTNTSSESLNIEKELKQRKILTKPFRHNAPGPPHSSSTSRSPCRNPKTKSYQNDMSGITQFTSALTSTDDQSENLEKDLQRLGIKWHGSMKKKTMETQALSSTSSSLEHASPRTKRVHIKETREKTIQTEEGGRQLNIREFLTRELLKRTTSTSSFSDDSLASSLLRSIIGSIASTPHSIEAGPTLDRHKTSTPMGSHSTSISGKNTTKSRGSCTSPHMFSGESLLSSVHYNNNSGDVNKVTHKDASSKIRKKSL